MVVGALSADVPEPASHRDGPDRGWAWPERQRHAGTEALAGTAGTNGTVSATGMNGTAETAGPNELVQRLFVPAERWGWEFAPPEPLPPPDDPRPAWQEPTAYEAALRLKRKRIRELPWSASGVAAMAAGGWVLPMVGGALATSGALVVGAAVVVVRQLGPRSRLETARDNRDFAYARYQDADEQWLRRREAREREEQRHAAAEHWFPLRPVSGAARVDVFGGTGDGWASLITTVGSSLLRSGGRVMVLDLSEQDVAGGLAAFAGAAGFTVSDIELLRDAPPSMLLQGLARDDAAEVVASAVATIRPPGESAEQRVIDADILTRVTGCLDEPLTFARLAAALLVIRGHHVEAATSPLGAQEIRALTAQIDLVGTTERVANALSTLGNLVGLLAAVEQSEQAEPEGPPAQAKPAWSAPDLTVLTSTSPHARRKDFLDRVLFQRVVHELRIRPPEGGNDVLFVAGADHLGLQGIEAMAKHARRAGVRLVLLLEHLRDGLTQLLGGAGNATILMRMGNAAEARMAAEFIGRDHTFKVSQVTRQVGKSFTDGMSDTWSTQSGSSDSSGVQRSKPKAARWYERKAGTVGSSAGATATRSNSWQYTASCSNTDSESTSTTDARMYEFTVEPTQIQGLPPTAFIMVDTGPDGRRVVMGDCNPGITLLPQVASGPRQ